MKTKDTEKMLDSIYDFIKNNEDTILIGNYAYNCFLNESGANKKYIDVPFYDIVLLNYIISFIR